jgi:4-amino-4-deoxy-L-arabinose transferase-like glycosyltransferase
MLDSALQKHPRLEGAIKQGVAFADRNIHKLILLALCSLEVVFIALFLWGTAPHGIGIRTDSVDYLWSAKNLANGAGLGTTDAFGHLRPLNHFPPFYPILLAFLQRIGMDGLTAARWLGALFVGALILLYWLILYRMTNRYFWLPTVGLVVLLFIPAFWDMSLYAMTEPLFLVCCLTGMICLDAYLVTNHKRWLWIASGCLGLAFLTRYIGISAILAGLAFLLLQKKRGARQKVQDLLILATVSVIPMGIGLLRNTLLTGSATNRGINFVPITAQEWISAFGTLMNWVEPIRAVVKINLLSLGIFVVALAVSWFLFHQIHARPTNQTATQLPLLLAFFGVAYLLLTITARLFADATIPLNEDRILYPFLLPMFFLAVYGLDRMMQEIRKRSIEATALLASLCVLIAWAYIRSGSSSTFPYIRPVLHSHVDGLGLQFRTNLASDFINAVAQLPPNAIVFTDNPEKLYFYTLRPSSYTGGFTPSELQPLQEQVAENMVAAIYFDLSPENQTILQFHVPQLKLSYHDSSGRYIYLSNYSP